MAPQTPRVAFVTGCTGISGNAIVENLIRQPKEEWSRIVVTSRSPLKNIWQDPRVEYVSVDLRAPVTTIIGQIEKCCKGVTHAYYTSYVHIDDFTKLRELNVPLFQNFLNAIDAVASDTLQRVCLQTGAKHYGVHLGPVAAPVHEGLPRYDDQGLNFYYAQEDELFKLSGQRNWTWNVIRPGGIVGFTPGKNGMSECLTLALYMLVSKEIGETPRFPGNKFFYNCVDDNSYAVSLADMTIWATTSQRTKNEAFNHANGDTFVWRYFFPKIGSYFGLEIPDQTEWPALGDKEVYSNDFKMAEWAKDKKPVWERICDKYGGNKEAFDWGTWGFFDWTIGKSWPTISSINKARRFGWTRHDDTFETWVETFRTFENAGILPPNRNIP
ncbi:hypothetical protein BDV12DRAFT_207071 [Aspergillus spectabilis]